MLDRQGVLTKLMHAREDIDLVIDSVLQGDSLRFNWTRLLAHSVNNHLTHIFFAMENFAQLDPGRSSEQLPLYINTLRDLAERIQETMGRLMAVAQMDNLVQLGQVDLCAAVSEALGRHRGYATLKSITLREQVSAPSPVIVQADRLGLVEALLNLIGNAIKYAPLGSEVCVAVSVEDDQGVCRVRDQGPGIGPEEQGKLFNLGSVLTAKPTAGEPQTGVGLALTFELVRAMGGTLWCESEPGSGSAFGICLPLNSRGAPREGRQDPRT
jgi:signal transduction histidine kinase